ncbi:MAG: hypothetical protein H5U11_05530 [Rhizobium sp.]|nr:hypothetical protein [Rhizobium sp.]
MMQTLPTPAERRLLLRLLKLALRGPLEVSKGEDGRLSVCCAKSGAEKGKTKGRKEDGPDGPDAGLPTRIADVPAGLLRFAVAGGLIVRDGPVLRSGEGTATYLRRAMVAPGDEAFLKQHRDMADETLVENGRRRPVRRNLAESPLSGLARLKDRNGAAYYDEQAIAAGERLAMDFERGGLQPRITASFEPRLAGRVRGAGPASVEIADSALGARARVNAAIEAMGPELAGVALDVCCFMKGLETVERERQWPARSAKLMLRAALLALARHYAPPPKGGRRRHHWGTQDFRPELG